MDTLENAQKRAEYWKAELVAANAEIARLLPDAELCRLIIDELVRQNNGMTPGWLLDMVPNA